MSQATSEASRVDASLPVDEYLKRLHRECHHFPGDADSELFGSRNELGNHLVYYHAQDDLLRFV